MKAYDLKVKYLKDTENISVIAFNENAASWGHIHDNEDIPEDVDIALHIGRVVSSEEEIIETMFKNVEVKKNE